MVEAWTRWRKTDFEKHGQIVELSKGTNIKADKESLT